MHKKLETDLMSLAHSLLKMKNKDDVIALKEKAQEIYEKLAMLAFVETYVNTTPTLEESKEELVSKVQEGFTNKTTTKKEVTSVKIPETNISNQENTEVSEPNKSIASVSEIAVDEEKTAVDEASAELQEAEEAIEQPFDDLEGMIFGDIAPQNFKDDPKDVAKTKTLEEELKDTIPVDIIANLFEPEKTQSLNNTLQNNINIGLNDRIAFVKNLFDGSQEDFNRVVSQLNTFKEEKEARKFITKMVKPDYNWSQQEELEARFMQIIARRFA